jgi:hypothetical protein
VQMLRPRVCNQVEQGTRFDPTIVKSITGIMLITLMPLRRIDLGVWRR